MEECEKKLRCKGTGCIQNYFSLQLRYIPKALAEMS
ncbi:hypothetical protein E2C01_091869 [Portunus trituberculatus]|uniref:Uncharacterized protein n=1 Tax=Portunus trituberculatus TaxID=210409 RepID=A0A5B7JF33_PORTR|nr:hypothetical protein [Portunus trituberculatus]